MPRCGAFGVRHLPTWCFAAYVLLFQCPDVGPSVCDRSAASWAGTIAPCFNAPVWGLRCATRDKRCCATIRCLTVSMPRCGAFGVRLASATRNVMSSSCFNAPVWGLRFATTTSGSSARSTRWRFNAPVWGLRFATRAFTFETDNDVIVFQCPGVGPSVCNLGGGSFALWALCFNAPVWGLRFAT